MRLFIGLMSGTSMDGIDAALIDVDTNTLLSGMTKPYSDKAKHFLQSVLSKEHTSAAILSQLNTILGREFAFAVIELLNLANIQASDVIAIGSHGQTICHNATVDIPYTVQLGCPHTIAELTGITVVADFRTRDLVVGGQGAPFAPIYHQALFAKQDLPLAIVNIGGIANVTYLTSKEVSGYDVGPGNCLLDYWVQKQLGLAYDAAGEWASRGKVDKNLLSTLLGDPFFKTPPPKSLGREYFSQHWLDNCLQDKLAPQDVQATLLSFTATTIADAIKRYTLPLKRIVICGGGVHNTSLLKALAQELPNLPVESTAALGVDPDFMEAMMFAWLADKALSSTPLDLRQITGASHWAILGAVYAGGMQTAAPVS